jgi:Sugar phosphate isomerases/epimerases
MKLGVLTVPLRSMPTAEAFKYLSGLGVQAVELGSGGYTDSSHLKPAELLASPAKARELKRLAGECGLTISALSCHGNPVHPDSARAKRDHETFLRTCELAETLEVDTVVTFSGCPGDGPGARSPNWVTCAWPDDYPKLLDWQWNEVLIPYWKNAAALASEHGIRKIALEMHPGFMVYNPSSLLRLRSSVGESIGANFDPSHLVWQGIDIVAAIRSLREAIFHFHAKDTFIDPLNCAVNGVLDTGSLAELSSRSWYFRTIGYGHDVKFWRDVVSALRLAGYDGALSIEHEDALMSPREGLGKAISLLKDALIAEPAGEAYWA